MSEERSGADVLVEHIRDCMTVSGALVVDGSADGIVSDLVSAGWTLEERVDYVAGKRIRFMSPPGGGSSGAQDGDSGTAHLP